MEVFGDTHFITLIWSPFPKQITVAVLTYFCLCMLDYIHHGDTSASLKPQREINDRGHIENIKFDLREEIESDL